MDQTRKQEELQQLRQTLGLQLQNTKLLKQPEGIPTGWTALDQFLLCNGFPKGALTALTGHLGLGATSLWVGAATHVLQRGRWAAWIDREAQLFPLTLWQKDVDLSRLVTIEAPQDKRKLLWLLQELMASTLFDLIGCDLNDRDAGFDLREHQLRKLQSQARSLKTVLVFCTGQRQLRCSSLFSLVIRFSRHEICIERALHRPTPHLLPRRITYANFTLHARSRFGSFVHPTGFAGLEPHPLFDSANSSLLSEKRRGSEYFDG